MSQLADHSAALNEPPPEFDETVTAQSHKRLLPLPRAVGAEREAVTLVDSRYLTGNGIDGVDAVVGMVGVTDCGEMARRSHSIPVSMVILTAWTVAVTTSFIMRRGVRRSDHREIMCGGGIRTARAGNG